MLCLSSTVPLTKGVLDFTAASTDLRGTGTTDLEKLCKGVNTDWHSKISAHRNAALADKAECMLREEDAQRKYSKTKRDLSAEKKKGAEKDARLGEQDIELAQLRADKRAREESDAKAQALLDA